MKLPGRDLVAKRLPDLRDAEGDLLARALENVQVVDVDALGGLRPEKDHRGLLLDRPHEGLEHEVEEPGLGQGALGAADWALGVGLARGPLDPGVVGPEAVLAVPAVDQGIGEAGHVARGLPDLGMHEDGGVEPLDVVPGVDHGPPPAVLHVLLELHPERTVVPDRAEAPVDLRGLEDEPPALAEGDQLVHQGGVGHGRACGEERKEGASKIGLDNRRSGVGGPLGGRKRPAGGPLPAGWGPQRI